MHKKKAYITDEEKINCQKVADAFSELYENEDLVVLDAGKYGFVKLRYFTLPHGFDNTSVFFDSKSLFNALWEEWLDIQLLDIAVGTPMEDMSFADILKCLPKEIRKKFLNKRLYFAEKADVEGILEEGLQRNEIIGIAKEWSRDWGHFDWNRIREKICGADIGISVEEFKEYFEWLYHTHSEIYYKNVLFMILVQPSVT